MWLINEGETAKPYACTFPDFLQETLARNVKFFLRLY